MKEPSHSICVRIAELRGLGEEEEKRWSLTRPKHFDSFFIAQSILASHPAASGLILGIPEKNISMLLRFINGAGKRKVDRCLKMLIEPTSTGKWQVGTTKKPRKLKMLPLMSLKSLMLSSKPSLATMTATASMVLAKKLS